jgi:cell division protein FtsQ
MLQKKLLRKFFNLLSFVLIILSLIIFVNFFLYFFQIKKIIIIAPKKSPVIKLSPLYNQSILFLSKTTLEKKLIETNPYLKEIKIEKKFPSTLIIYPKFYHPQAQLKVNRGYFILSENGRILEKITTNQDQLIPINFYQKLNFQEYSVGNFVTYKDLITSLKIIPIFEKFNIKINSIDILGFSMIVFNLDNRQVLFDANKNIDQTEYELNEILKRLKIEGKNFKKLDLRFNKPIIVF